MWSYWVLLASDGYGYPMFATEHTGTGLGTVFVTHGGYLGWKFHKTAVVHTGQGYLLPPHQAGYWLSMSSNGYLYA